MKKILLSLMAVLMTAVAFVGCGSNSNNSGSGDEGTVANVPTADIVASIMEGMELRAMGPVEGEMATETFFLNEEDVEEFSIQQGMMNTGLEVVAVVKAKDGKVDAVKESLNKVIEKKKEQAFYPGEPEAVEDARLEVVGNYVALIIIPEYEEGQNNNQKAVDAFKAALEQK